jgi:hypothetical protein
MDNIFCTEPLLNEINSLVKKGVEEILHNFMDRYILLENTHQAIMNLPSVKYYINVDANHETNKGDVKDKDILSENKRSEMIDDKIEKMEKK